MHSWRGAQLKHRDNFTFKNTVHILASSQNELASGERATVHVNNSCSDENI
jgi:hypothetical protein